MGYSYYIYKGKSGIKSHGIALTCVLHHTFNILVSLLLIEEEERSILKKDMIDRKPVTNQKL